MHINEGPTVVTIPMQQCESCSGCKYLSHKLVKSGKDPVYANNCTHPEGREPKYRFGGTLETNEFGVVVTPNWCPFKIKQP